MRSANASSAASSSAVSPSPSVVISSSSTAAGRRRRGHDPRQERGPSRRIDRNATPAAAHGPNRVRHYRRSPCSSAQAEAAVLEPTPSFRLDSWLQLDFVHTEHLWHCRSSPLLTNPLSHLLMVATRSRQKIPRTVTANPRTRLCLRSGVIPRRTVCTWADLTAVIGFHPNLKPLQRHNGVGLRACRG
jgi:hypothetical protein